MHNASEMIEFVYVSLALAGTVAFILISLGIYGLIKYFRKGIK